MSSAHSLIIQWQSLKLSQVYIELFRCNIPLRVAPLLSHLRLVPFLVEQLILHECQVLSMCTFIDAVCREMERRTLKP